MKILVNWWEIGNNQFLHLTKEALFWIEKDIQEKFGNLCKLSKKLNLPNSDLYSKFRYKHQGISVKLLKQILNSLEIPLDVINNEIKSIGIQESIKQINLPVKLSPKFGQLLAHGFFDGYVDSSIFRYSNYDLQIREQFVQLISELNFGKIKVNKPENYERDIDLPESICKFLLEVFRVNTFKSKECRIPKCFFDIVKYDKIFGYFFVKGAYLDEGTISGKQLWLVRGLHNEKMAEDLIELCKLLCLKAKGPKITGKWNETDEYSVLIPEESYQKFKKILMVTKITSCDKINRAIQKIENCINTRKKENKYKHDLRIIIEKTKKEGYITIADTMNLCGLTQNQALYRLYLLVRTENLLVVKRRGKSFFYFKKFSLPINIPRINDIRRKEGWI